MKTTHSSTASGTALSAAAAGFLQPLRALAASSDQLWSDGSYADLYLSENFGPVMEEVTATELEVLGSIPAELSGRYLRNGPNPLGSVDSSRHHWFSGEGMVHGVRLDEGRADWYRNRWVRSADLVKALGRRGGRAPACRRQQHPCDQPCGTHPGDCRGRFATGGAELRTRYGGRQ